MDLSRRNRALNLPTRSGPSNLRLLEPSPGEILAGVGRSPGWRFHYPPLDEEESQDAVLAAAIHAEDPDLTDEHEPDELLTDIPTSSVLSKAVRNLERRAAQEYLDKGLRILYLALGVVSWTDEFRDTWRSPVLLVPVQLHRPNPRAPFRLLATEDDSFINPSLILKLQESGIELGDLSEEGDIASDLDDALRALRSHDTLEVENAAILSVFSFQKEVMYRDLKDNEAVIAEHPIVGALALGPEGGQDLSFSAISESRLDEVAPPEETISILDSDATQRVCIVSAREGKSFVMDGPPGSGKSQTIANMVAELLANQKSVLFVSEKAAALEVVKQRLDTAGLGSYVLNFTVTRPHARASPPS